MNLQDPLLKWHFWSPSKSILGDAPEVQVKVKSPAEVPQILEVFEVEVGEVVTLVMTMTEASNPGLETMRTLRNYVKNPDRDPDLRAKNGIVDEVKVEIVI